MTNEYQDFWSIVETSEKIMVRCYRYSYNPSFSVTPSLTLLLSLRYMSRECPIFHLLYLPTRGSLTPLLLAMEAPPERNECKQ